MRNPHFFKAYCRLGINHLPYLQTDSAVGVEKAPDFILTPRFLNNFENYQVSSFNFTSPEEIKPTNYYESAVDELIKFKNILSAQVKKDEALVVIGGDHSITFPSLIRDIKRYRSDFGIIHFDSHPDFNLYKHSPSRNFHGMYLRAFFDHHDLPSLEKAIPDKLKLENILFVGDLELNPEEADFFNKQKPKVTSHKGMATEKEKNLKIIKEFIEDFSHIHLSFDVDVFKKELVSATTTPSADGFGEKEIFEILRILKQSKSLTLDIAEVNPRKIGAEKTIKIAQKVILTLLS